jgi:acetylornithine deacetylase
MTNNVTKGGNMLSESKQKVLEQIERNWDGEIEFLQELVRRPSTLGNEAQIQNFIAEKLREMNLAPDVWQIDHAELAQTQGYSPVEWSYEGRPNVAATWTSRSQTGKSLIFQGHIDVVPATPEGHWTRSPWGGDPENGRVYGRGAADMKAGVAAMIYATRALQECGVQLQGDLTLETVIEEECTGNGALATLVRGYKADAVIIPEPTDLEALESQVGVMWVRVTVKGAGAHAMAADKAVNAIKKVCYLLEAVEELEDKVNAEPRGSYFESHPHPLNYNVGVVRGGDWASNTPEECSFEVRISAFPGQDLNEVQARFKEHLLEASKADSWLAKNPPQISFYAFRAEGCTISRDEPIFPLLSEIHEAIVGDEMKYKSFTGTTDARFYSLYYDIPTTCYGPVGGSLHAPDEWVDLESVKQTTKVLALMAMDWCGVE